jgi:RNA polymerase sigma-70 factor (ECF subfamily)
MTGLSDRERAAAILCFAEGCSHSEAALALGLPLGTVKSLAARARSKLLSSLEPRHD